MNRSPKELQQAAADAGWADDPLASEILTVLSVLERESGEMSKRAAAAPKRTGLIVIATSGFLLALALGVAVAFQFGEIRSLKKQIDLSSELSRVAELNTQLRAAIGDAGGQAKASLESTAKLIESTSEANQEMLRLYIETLKKMEADRARAEREKMPEKSPQALEQETQGSANSTAP